MDHELKYLNGYIFDVDSWSFTIKYINDTIRTKSIVGWLVLIGQERIIERGWPSIFKFFIFAVL